MAKVTIPEADQTPGGSRIGRLLRRVVLGVVGLLLLLVVLVVASIFVDSVVGQDATDFSNVTYSAADGSELHAYLAEPSGSGPYPAVVMFHEWWGLNEDITRLADRLAQEGYVVLAPNAYRGESTGWIPSAVWLVSTTAQEQIADDVDRGFDYLLGLESVDPQHIGTVGFCFGGRQSFWLAWRQQERVDAVVSLYGTTFGDEAELANFDEEAPILAIYGAEDSTIAADGAREMDRLMDAAGLQHTVTIYDGVGHAFVNSENIDEAGAAGDAWDELVTFFNRHLKGEAAGIRSTARSKAATAAADAEHFICIVP